MRKRVLACVLGVAGALWLVPTAAADTATIGAAAPDSGLFFGGCDSPCAYMQETTDAASPSYVVPPVPAGGASWSVTSWSALGGPGDSSASLEIWRPTGAPNEFRLMAIGPDQPFPVGALTSHTVSIPVLPGDHLGVQASDADFRPIYSSPPAGNAWMSPHELPAVGETAGGSMSDHNPVGRGADGSVNVQAVVTSAPATSTPNSTPVKKKCKKKKHKRSAESAKKKKCKKRKKR
jgi:hypothetical protein